MRNFFVFAIAVLCTTCSALAATVPSPVKQTSHFGTIEIQITESEDAEGNVDSTVQTVSAGKVIQTKVFSKIGANGGSAGLSLPSKQPLSQVFIIKKDGDYDSRVVLVDRAGKIIDMPGATLFLSANRELLFILRVLVAEPYPVYAVFDLKKSKVLLSGVDSEKVHTLPEEFEYEVKEKAGTYFVVGHPGPDWSQDHAGPKVAYAAFDLRAGIAKKLEPQVGSALEKGAKKLRPFMAEPTSFRAVRKI